MQFTKLVPNVFYTDIQAGLRLFVDCLEFTIGHDELHTEHPFCVVEKDGLRLNLFQNREFAEKDRPEFRLVTNNIEEAYQKIATLTRSSCIPTLARLHFVHGAPGSLPCAMNQMFAS